MKFTEDEVLKLVQPLADKFKSIDAKLIKGEYIKADDMPEFHSTYRLCVKYAERIKIHAEICGFPEELFLAPAPNQTEKEFKYMKDNFKQNTLPVYLDYLSTIGRAFNDTGWGIDYVADDDAFKKLSLQDYLENEINNFGSLESYVKSVIPHYKTVDADGAIGVKPRDIPIKKDADGEPLQNDDGELLVDTSKLMEPQPYYYSSRQILSSPANDREYFVFWSNDKSEVLTGSKKEYIGHVFEVYDSENIWRVEQVGKFTDYKFNAYVYFNHSWDKVPAKRFGGIPQLVGDVVVWQSSYLYACDLLDLVLINGNYLEASDKNVMFPYRVMLGSKCEFKYKDANEQECTCDGGQVYDSVKIRYLECPACKGAGVKDRVSRTGQMLLFPADMLTEGEQKYSSNAMYYVSPGTDPSKYMIEKISMYEDRARKILHLQTSNSLIKGTENLTATGMGLDEQAKFAFVKMSSQQMFSMYGFLIDAIGWQRYAGAYKKPVLTEPVSFEFKTQEDYLREISEAQKAGLPPLLIQSILYKFLQTLFYNEKQTEVIFKLIISVDRFFPISNSDLFLKFNRGLAEKWEVIIHDSALSLVGELVGEDEKFFEKKFEDQRQELIDLAKERAGTDAKIIDISGGGNLGKIPLALQEMGLAAQRAHDLDDPKLSKKIRNQMGDLVKQIDDAS